MERDFKGIWIPKEIWFDERLSPLDKMILCEIDSLCSPERGCYASNEYLADFCQCSISKVTKSIKKLIECDYVAIESFNGRMRILRSRLVKNTSIAENTSLHSKKYEADSQKIPTLHIENNNRDVIDDNKATSRRFVPPTVEEVRAYCNERQNNIIPEAFVDFYTANGWVQGKAGKPVKDWKACVRTWERNGYNNGRKGYNNAPVQQKLPTADDYDEDAFYNM